MQNNEDSPKPLVSVSPITPHQQPARLSLFLAPDTLAEVDGRADVDGRGFARGPVIDEALQRYFYMLGLARTELENTFTDAELKLILDSCNGTMFEAWSFRHIAEGVSDSIALDGVDEKWGVDGPTLIEKLQGINLLQTAALVDAVERFWKHHAENPEVTPDRILRTSSTIKSLSPSPLPFDEKGH